MLGGTTFKIANALLTSSCSCKISRILIGNTSLSFRISKVNSKNKYTYPNCFTRSGSIRIFTFPFVCKIIESSFSRLFRWSSVDMLHIGRKFFSVLPYHIFAGISVLMDNTNLGLTFRKNRRYSLVNPFKLSAAE